MNEMEILRLVEEENPNNPLSYVQNIVKPLCINKLNNYILTCNDCNICNTTKTITVGDCNSPILILGEASSYDQQNSLNNYDIPFNNEAGNILDNIISKLNISKNKLFFINAVNCFPNRLDKNKYIKRSPTVNERRKCKTFIDYAIKVVDPLLIICLGNVATNDINEEIGKQAISKIRGKYFNYRGIKVMPTYHPQYFLELTSSGKMDTNYINKLYLDFYKDIEKAFNDFSNEYSNINIYKEY